MPKRSENAFGGIFRREHRLKKEPLADKERESLSLLSLPIPSTSVSPILSALPFFFFILLYSGASHFLRPGSLRSLRLAALAPDCPVFLCPPGIPITQKIFNRARTRPSPFVFLAHSFRAKRFKHNARRGFRETLRILLAHVFPLGIASSVFQAFQAF